MKEKIEMTLPLKWDIENWGIENKVLIITDGDGHKYYVSKFWDKL